MNILCVGDVVGEGGQRVFADRIPALRRDTGADLVIVNGENSDKGGLGVSRPSAEALLQYADVVTGGNHSWDRADETLYAEHETLLYPANYPGPGREGGACVIDTGRLGAVRVISLCGTARLEALDNPFFVADALLAEGGAKYTVIDFHAESTAEKKAFAWHLDGRVGAIFGTHTHVQTADEQVLPKGTGFITDVGMTGPVHSVIGVEPGLAVRRQREHRPARFAVAGGPCQVNAVLFTLDDDTGLCVSVRRVSFKEEGPPTPP